MNKVVQNYKRTLNESYKRELGDFTVIKDIGKGCMLTFIECLESVDGDLLYFEDDVILCKDFMKELNNKIEKYGSDKILQLFSLKRTYKQDMLMTPSTYLANVAIYLPNKVREGIIKYWNNLWKYSETYKNNPTAMDYLVRDYLKFTKTKYYLIVPNLAQHQVGKSVIDSRRSSKRQSLYFIDGKES